jgi:hypothetical protein
MTETAMHAKADLASGATVEITAVREFTYLGGSRAGEVVLYQVRAARTGRWIPAAEVLNLTH